jgi:tripartite-type tricarboxylate transporter receptor subunit TctC
MLKSVPNEPCRKPESQLPYLRCNDIFKLSLFHAAAIASIMLMLMSSAVAQGWPKRAVRLIVPFGPASATDLAARLIGGELSTLWQQAVVVENKAGGDGLLAMNAFLSAKDDHVLFFTSTGAFLAHPYLHKRLDYVFERDFLPIAKVADTMTVVAIPEALGIRSLSEFVRAAEARPEAMNLAGATGLAELAVDAFLRKEKLKSVRVPYKDLTAAARDLAENRIQFLLTSYASVQPFVEGGKVRIIAAGMSDWPQALREPPPKLDPAYSMLAIQTSVAIFGPKGMSVSLRATIARDVESILAAPTIRRRIEITGQRVDPVGPAELTEILKRQAIYVASIVRESSLDPTR